MHRPAPMPACFGSVNLGLPTQHGDVAFRSPARRPDTARTQLCANDPRDIAEILAHSVLWSECPCGSCNRSWGKMAEHQRGGVEAQLKVALDNMPGALMYTDALLNIVFCNVQFRQMYTVPSELLQSGRPYPAFLRYLAENGYYGKG